MRNPSYSFIISGFLLLILSAQKSNAFNECGIQDSIYRDVDGKGFELIFEAIEPPMGSLASSISIEYSGEAIYQFDMSQGTGYGSFFASQGESSLLVNFFDSHLTSNNPSFIGPEIKASKFMFISGLGSFDYYQRTDFSPNFYPPLIGDTVWIFDRCR